MFDHRGVDVVRTRRCISEIFMDALMEFGWRDREAVIR